MEYIITSVVLEKSYFIINIVKLLTTTYDSHGFEKNTIH